VPVLADVVSMTAINALAPDLLACRIVDLSSDVGDCAPGPFQAKVDVIESAEGAEIFCEKVVPALVPEAVSRLRPDHSPGSQRVPACSRPGSSSPVTCPSCPRVIALS
jgi:hypothetical protein